MNILHAIVLGGVQGVTEFLPVSSDGHLYLTHLLFRWPDEGLSYDAALHLGTFCSLLLVFRARVWELFRVILGKGTAENRRLLWLIVLATIPGAAAGFFGENFVATVARGPVVAAGGFLVSAVLLFAAELVLQKATIRHTGAVTLRQALTMGFLQVIALLPGLSRSGSTMAGGVMTGLTRSAAAEFSFLLALPVVGGAGLKGMLDVSTAGNALLPLLVGFLVAFGVGVWAIRFLLSYVRTNSYTPFIVYLCFIALVTLIVGR